MKFNFGVSFGSVSDAEIDWSDLADSYEPDDDATRPTPADVVGMLGFDPMEEFGPEEGGRKGKKDFESLQLLKEV
jgi:hypothetical protein